MKKRMLAVLLSFVMAFAMVMPAVAVGSDVNGHWAQSDIEYLNLKGIMKGYPDGSFKPNNKISKAEYITLINRTFDISSTGYISYPDVKSTAWYYDEIVKADAFGYLFTFSNKVNPDANLTREEAAAMFGKLLGLSGSNTSTFTDSGQFSDWSRDYIGAVADAGIINGYPDGSFRPKETITRAEVARVVCNVIGNYYDAAGMNSTAVTKNVTIAASGVTLQNVTIPGNLYITDGARNGTVTLNNVTVNGKILAVGSPGCTVVLSGNSTAVSATPEGLKYRVTGTVGTLTLTSQYGSASLEIAEGGHVQNLVMNCSGAITGTGEIDKATVNMSGVTSSIQPDEWVLKYGVSAVFAGKVVTASGKAGPSFTEGYPKATLAVMGTTGTSNILVKIKAPQTGRVYAIAVSRGSTAPTAAQVKALQSYGYVTVLRGNMAEISAVGNEVTLTLSSLPTAALYDVWVVAEDSAAVPVLGEPVKLEPTQSVFSADYPRVYAASGTSASVEVKTTRAVTAYWAVLPKTSAAPTAQQLISQTGLGTICGVKTLQSGVADFISVYNLTGGVSGYTFYIVTKDGYNTIDPATPESLDLSAAENSVKAVFSYQPTNNEYPSYTSINLEFTKDMYRSGTATPMSFLSTGIGSCITITGKLAANNTEVSVTGYTLVPTSNKTVAIAPPAGGWSAGVQYTINITGLADANGQQPTPATITFSTTGGQSLVAAPTASQQSGTSVLPGSYITLSTTTAGAVIQYNMTGLDPMIQPYSTGAGTQTMIQIPENLPAGTVCIIRAVARLDSRYSSVAEFTYIVGATIAAPTAGIATGSTVYSGTLLTLSCADSAATIYYTTDGTTPSIASQSLPGTGGTIYVTGAQGAKFTVKALAIKNGTASVIKTFEYYIGSGSGTGARPSAPAVYIQSNGQSSTASNGQSYTLYSNGLVNILAQSASVNAVLYYTLDGSDPSSSATRYYANGQSFYLNAQSFQGSQQNILKVAVYDPSSTYWQSYYSETFTIYLYVLS